MSAPLVCVVDASANPPAPRVRNLPLVLLVLLHMAAAVAAVALGPSGSRLVNVLALTLTQTLLCSYIAALGSGRLAWRWPLAALLVAFVAAFALGCLRATTPYLLVLMTSALFTLWLVAQVPLWLLRVRFRWCLARGNISDIPIARDELQFGIKHILGLTAVVAILCSVARWVFTPAAMRTTMDESGLAIVFLLLVAFSTLLCVLPLWAALTRDRRRAWWQLTLTYSVTVVGIEPWVFTMVLGDHPDGNFVLWWLGFVEVASLLASLLLVRAAGFRLVRLASSRNSTE